MRILYLSKILSGDIMSAIVKSTLREIKNSIGRYLAIFAIIALGVGFFAGLRLCKPTLVGTAGAYFDNQNMYDFKALSSLGFSTDSIEKLKEKENIITAEGANYEDVLVTVDSNDFAMRVHSVTEDVNQLNIIAGRIPQNENECVVDADFFSEDIIGKTIVFSDNTNEDALKAFKTKEFTVVGRATSPLYISTDRGSTSLGDGSIAAFIFINRTCFTADYYKEIYLVINDGDTAYSDAYKACISENKSFITEVIEEQADARYNKIVADAQAEVDSARSDLDASKAELDSKKNDAILEVKRQMEAMGVPATEDNPAYLSAMEEINKSFEEPEKDLSDAYSKLEEAEREVDEIEAPSVFILTREENAGYVSFGQDSSIIENISVVFPIFFFLVAALVCVTTMTRMVDEQRTQIGVWKAMGYNKRRIIGKYLVYSGSAGLLGSVVGFLAGTVFIPKVFWGAYHTVYNFADNLTYIFDWKMYAASLGIAMLCTAGTTWLCCQRELNEVPASILRPKTPKNGKRILLERFKVLWRHIGFLQKVSLRNVLRYKQRFFLMILGISGCTALLVTGFGIRDSIQNVTDYQYGEISLYDAEITFSHSLSRDEESEFSEKYSNLTNKVAFLSVANADISANGITKSAKVSAASQELEEFIDMHTGNTAINYPKDGEIIVCKETAEKLGISYGDVITLTNDDFDRIELTVTGVLDNYIGNYLFVTPATMRAFCETDLTNSAYVIFSSDVGARNASATLLGDELVGNITLNQDIRDTIETSFESLNLVVVLIILCAGGLAFIVLFNLININIGERIREIATIKVLGFYSSETSAYVFREINMLTVIGALLGLLFGKLLHVFVMDQIKPDGICFDSRIAWASYLFGFVLTLVFAEIVKIAMRRKLRKINMAESLKSVE